MTTRTSHPASHKEAGGVERGRHGRFVQLSTIRFIVSGFLRGVAELRRRLSAVSIAVRKGVSAVLSPLVSTSRFHSIAPLAKLSQAASNC